MAMALRAALPRFDPARVSILATDLNDASLAFARAAVYREWSFRRTPPAMRAAWFTAAGPGVYALRREIRDQVRFARLNLAAAGYPSAAGATEAMDVIFCRNVLMYFSKSQMKAATGRLRECLVDGGWLVVNPSEASAELFEGFRAHCLPDAVLYQKVAAPRPARGHSAQSVRRAEAVPAPAPEPKRCSAGPAEPARAGVVAGSCPDARQLPPHAAGSNPLAPEPYQAAAQLALEQGDHAAARRHLQRQLYLEPGSILAHYLNGVAQLGLGRRAAALRAFEASAALLSGVADEAPVPGADGWRAAGLRAALRAWTERAA
jgi:chemotaxis protein methyltransferase CheR